MFGTVSELNSPTRFVEMASRMGLRPGFVIDLLAGRNLQDQGHLEVLENLVKDRETLHMSKMVVEKFFL